MTTTTLLRPLAVLAILATTVVPVVSAADSTWTWHLQHARAAMAASDDAAARRHLLAVDSLVGGHTGAKSALATLAGREGRRDEALRWLRALAETGIARSIAADSAFARWREDPEFREVAARLEANAQPKASARLARTMRDTSLLAEDLAWDERTKRTLVSSIHRGGIVVVDSLGRESDLVAPGAGGTWGMYALALDSRRDVLWATTAAGPEYAGFAAADSGRTALLALDPATGRELRRLELPRTPQRQVLGDLSLGPDGTVYVTESVGGAVYRLRPKATALDTLVAPGTFRSPQGSAVAADVRRLFVADYSRGIAVVDLRSGATSWLPKPYSLSSGGIDGLYRDGGRLIAVQNGTEPKRILALSLDPAGTKIAAWRVLEQASESLGEPNHGTIVGREFWFIGDSGWDRVGEDGRLASRPGAGPPRLMRLDLSLGR